MTQEDKVFNYIKQHGSITQLQALMDIGVMRLASRVCDMKKAGLDISKRMIQVTARDGSKCYVAQYYFGQEAQQCVYTEEERP